MQDEASSTGRAPRGVLLAAAGLIAFTILAAAVGRWTGVGVAEVATTAPVEAVELRFQDRPDGAVAVYEALANVVDHAYADRGAPGLMTLWSAVSCPLLTGRDLVVTVVDEGAWRPSSSPGWRGRGLPLMRELMHSTAVLPGAQGTTVQLRRRVPVPDRDRAAALV